MDGFQIIAEVFKKDCMLRLKMLEEVSFILDSSDTIGNALGMIFMHSTLYPDDIEQIKAIKAEILQLHNCIDATEVGGMFSDIGLTATDTLSPQENMTHARKIFKVNFGNNPKKEKSFTFNQEICYSYVCKMLHSIGPRKQHFSNAPTHDEIVNAELFLALHSPYSFGSEDLLCYESMD